MSDTTNILIVGVGGQGTILASKILAGAAQKKGLDVKVAEIHGMSQRGGSVFTQVRYGQKVTSPVIPHGEADILLSFEKLEALRWLSYIKDNAYILVNDQQIDPMPVITGTAAYPDALAEIIGKNNTAVINGLEKAVQAGSVKAVNMVLLGYLSGILEFEHNTWLEVIRETVHPRYLEVNLRAFEAGRACHQP